MTVPDKTIKSDTDPILVGLVIMVSLLCLFPTLMGDLISLATNLIERSRQNEISIR